jgi:hypothetical protein
VPCEHGDGWSRRSRGSTYRASSQAHGPTSTLSNIVSFACETPTYLGHGISEGDDKLIRAFLQSILGGYCPRQELVIGAEDVLGCGCGYKLTRMRVYLRISWPFLSCDKLMSRMEKAPDKLTSLTVAKVSRPSKMRSTFCAASSSSVTSKVFLNAHSVSPTPIHTCQTMFFVTNT